MALVFEALSHTVGISEQLVMLGNMGWVGGGLVMEDCTHPSQNNYINAEPVEGYFFNNNISKIEVVLGKPFWSLQSPCSAGTKNTI